MPREVSTTMITDATTEQLRCPKCGRDVEVAANVAIAEANGLLGKPDLYGAAVRQIAKLGGDRRTDTGHARGNADESLAGERTAGESSGDDDRRPLVPAPPPVVARGVAAQSDPVGGEDGNGRGLRHNINDPP